MHSTTDFPSVKLTPVPPATPDGLDAAAVLPNGQWARRRRQPEVHAPCPRCGCAQSLITTAQCHFEWAWCRECHLSAPTDTVRDGTWPDEAETRAPRSPTPRPAAASHPAASSAAVPPLTLAQLHALRAGRLLRLWLHLHRPATGNLTRRALAAALGTDDRSLRALLRRAIALGLVVRHPDHRLILAARLPGGLRAERLLPLEGWQQRALLAQALGQASSQRALQRATGLSHDRLRAARAWLPTAEGGVENTQGGGVENTHPARPHHIESLVPNPLEGELHMQHAAASAAVAPLPPELIGHLLALGFRPDAARRLIAATSPDAVQAQLDFWPQYQALYDAAGQTIRHPAAFLAAAVRRGYAPDPGILRLPRSDPEPLSAAAEATVAQLTALDMHPAVSRRLVQQFPASTRRQLAWWPQRRGIADPPAFLAAAIRRDFPAPLPPPAPKPAPAPDPDPDPAPKTTPPLNPERAWVHPDAEPPWPRPLDRTPEQERRWTQARHAAQAASQEPEDPADPRRGYELGLAAHHMRRIVQPVAWQDDVVTLAANILSEHDRMGRGRLGQRIVEALAAVGLEPRWYDAPTVDLQVPVAPDEAWEYLQEITQATAAVARWRFDDEARTLHVGLEDPQAEAPLAQALQALLGPSWTLRAEAAQPGWWTQPDPDWTEVQAWLMRQSKTALGLALLSQLQPVAWRPADGRAAFRLPAALARAAPRLARRMQRWVQHRLAARTDVAWAVDFASEPEPARTHDGLRQALERAGVGFRAARSLARTRPDVCLRQLVWHEDRLAALDPVVNPGGLLAQAIRDDYAPPPAGR